jgi:hypothetical protein
VNKNIDRSNGSWFFKKYNPMSRAGRSEAREAGVDGLGE